MDICSVHCAKCKLETKHDIIASENTSWRSDEEDIRCWCNYQIVRCRGCETISFRIVSGSSEDYDPFTGEDIVSVELYPEREYNRSCIEGYIEFPSIIRKIYKETIDATNKRLI